MASEPCLNVLILLYVGRQRSESCLCERQAATWKRCRGCSWKRKQPPLSSLSSATSSISRLALCPDDSVLMSLCRPLPLSLAPSPSSAAPSAPRESELSADRWVACRRRGRSAGGDSRRVCRARPAGALASSQSCAYLNLALPALDRQPRNKSNCSRGACNPPLLCLLCCLFLATISPENRIL